MNNNLQLRSLKKRLAMNGNADDALSVILPRLMGAIKDEKDPVFSPNELRTNAGGYEIRLYINRHFVFLRLHGADEAHILFACRIYSGMLGSDYGGLLDILEWDRSEADGGWQEEIFDVFKRDSDWLLSLPRIEDYPLIVRVARAEMQRLWALKVDQSSDPDFFEDLD